ncbi:hypothetical protein OpiT1DRAFT_00943 [Opitutaceae bacterium TAV1]|nr:hypothetical protein OpiT1DRAFT_00943 [Opitutaceae bacterium TAV1]
MTTPRPPSLNLVLSILVLTLAGCTCRLVAADTVVLKNSTTEIHVSIPTGKMMFFGIPDGPNLFWTPQPASSVASDASPAMPLIGTTGGSRMYPAQQALWHFIWGEEWSGRKFETLRWHLITQTEHSILLQSEPCQELSLILRREFIIPTATPSRVADTAGPTATVIDTAARTAPNPFPVQLWTVTQIPWPRRLVMTTNGKPYVIIGNRRYYRPTSIQTRSNFIELDLPNILTGLKIGTPGDRLEATFGSGILLKQGRYNPEACYPDGASVECYIDKEFVELETFSESLHLKPGETLSFTTTWRFSPSRN